MSEHSFDKRKGGHHKATSNSLSGMLSTLIPPFLLSCAFIFLFLILRARKRRVYQPRTYLNRFHDHEKTPKTSSSMFGWVKQFWSLPDEYILSHQSLDGYLYLRFFRVLATICFVSCCISWPILFPVYITAGGGQKQFDMLSLSNVPGGIRYLAPCLVGMLVMGVTFFVIARESIFFIHLRQAYLLSPRVASRISSRTVVFTDVPQDYLEESRLRRTFAGIETVWLATDCKELEKLVEDRDKTAMNLEGAEIKLSKSANQKRLKTLKRKNRKAFDTEAGPMQWVDEKSRPTHRLKPLFGEKVDTIDWSRRHLQELIPKVEALQSAHWNGRATIIPAVIIEFSNVQAAQLAYQLSTYHVPKVFPARAIGARPSEIVWSNLGVSWWSREVRSVIATGFISAMIIFWAIPVAFVGLISNINYLETISFLHWISKIPPSILGVLTGLLPVVALVILMALVPIVCRLVAKFAGAATIPEIELKTQSYYFAFQVVQVFLVATIASAATSVAKEVAANPGSIFKILSTQLPKASNFYINYFTLQGANFGGVIANIVGFIVFILLGKLLDNTPRKKYNRYTSVGGLSWGATYPVWTNIGVIALTYSVIAPLVLGFASAAFFLLYSVNRYNIMYTKDTNDINLQGQGYVKALGHLTTGVYLSALCLIGLFATQLGSELITALPLGLMVLFLVFMILFHRALNASLKPLTNTLPRDLLALSTQRMVHESQHVENGQVHSASLAQSEKSNGISHEEKEITQFVQSTQAQNSNNPKSIIAQFFKPKALPTFSPHMSRPIAPYPEGIRGEAYFNPAITSPAPILWLVHDNMGLSQFEKEASRKIIRVSDSSAWWDEKGKLQTGWEIQEAKGMDPDTRDAPIYEPAIEY